MGNEVDEMVREVVELGWFLDVRRFGWMDDGKEVDRVIISCRRDRRLWRGDRE